MNTINQKKSKRRYAYVGLIGLAVVSAVLVWSHLNKESAIGATLEWARLAPIPDSAREVTVIKQGGMFTREFWVFFSADHGDVKGWVDSSDGFQDAKATALDGIRMTHYAINPGGGAQFAEAIVFLDGSVIIHADWS